jgi:hypothetical protein
VASPRESRWSDSSRLTPRLALGASLAAFDARAHGGAGLDWLIIPFLIIVTGFLASGVVHMLYGRAWAFLRFLQAIALVALDVAITVGAGYAVGFALRQYAGYTGAGGQAVALVTGICLNA